MIELDSNDLEYAIDNLDDVLNYILNDCEEEELDDLICEINDARDKIEDAKGHLLSLQEKIEGFENNSHSLIDLKEENPEELAKLIYQELLHFDWKLFRKTVIEIGDI